MTLRRSLALAVAALAVPVALAACSSGPVAATLPPIPSQAPATPTPAPESAHPTSGIPEGCPKEQPAALPAGETRTVTIKTDKGTIVVKIEADLSPIAAGNFVALAECGYYDGVVFHRIAPGFVIQGGDGQFGRSPNVFTDIAGSGGPGFTIKDEPVTGDYTRGTLAMAKTGAPDSAGSQFFIVLQDLGSGLDKRYQIFGHVTEGMDVVDTISNMPNDGSQISLAVDPIAMTDVSVTTP